MKLEEITFWITPSEAAERLGISRQAVHKMYLADGRLRAVKTRQGWLIDPEAVDRVARDRAEQGQPDA